ncbi:hypothetical protein E2C01_082504 [Portunus trituberculatus]|uniref:Uncharacterized protein n=1 Tax=Portunus trituberculatus TaxID=210409 RepID=A0A5B7J546_PORTR|nr:hypothetical protein [Portunus trituberculatus]
MNEGGEGSTVPREERRHRTRERTSRRSRSRGAFLPRTRVQASLCPPLKSLWGDKDGSGGDGGSVGVGMATCGVERDDGGGVG